jgi:3-deoxy-D-manno-octulosonate 8-phosphate phosphatase (KDO 8-P phosphatase)
MYSYPFVQAGAHFVGNPEALQHRLGNIRALLFDWDGVFNSGEKGELPSSFNEVDSMGVNMLRFGYYLLHGTLPFTAIVTGQNNPTAMAWSKREHLNNVFFHVKDKLQITHYLETERGIYRDEVLFVYDDILDLSLAKEAGARMLVQHRCNPLFLEYCKKNGLCDYITANDGASGAVREICEMTLHALGLFEETLEKRIEFEGIYSRYLQARQETETTVLEARDNALHQV